MQTTIKTNKAEFRRVVQVHEDFETENSYQINKII